MKIWFRRILALALISIGISMTFLPFNDTQSGSNDQEIVTLQILDFIAQNELDDKFLGMEITELTGPEFNPDDYPDLWECFINLSSYDSPSEICNLNEWNEFQSAVLEGILNLRLVVYREMLISCSIEKSTEEEEISEVVLFKSIGKYNPYIQTLTENDLKNYPTIILAINNVDSNSELISIPNREWDRMVDEYLDPMNDLQTFNFESNYYGPEFGWDYVEIKGTISNLSSTLKIIGIIFLLLGITTLVKLYFSKTKKGINPPKFTILLDAITLLFAIPSAYMCLNLLLSKTLFISPIIEDEFLLFMGVFFFIVGIPALARYTSKYATKIVNKN